MIRVSFRNRDIATAAQRSLNTVSPVREEELEKCEGGDGGGVCDIPETAREAIGRGEVTGFRQGAAKRVQKYLVGVIRSLPGR